MNNSLNLASKPFSNRILPWALTAIVLFVSLIGLILVVRLTTQANREADTAQAEINGLKQQEKALLEAAEKFKNTFSADQQQALPAAHQLVDRKTFSWSGLLADLEASLPSNVKVSRISIRDVSSQANQTVAQLDLAQSTVSQHLKVLVEAGLVRFSPERQRSRYAVDRDALRSLSQSVSGLLQSCCGPTGRN